MDVDVDVGECRVASSGVHGGERKGGPGEGRGVVFVCWFVCGVGFAAREGRKESTHARPMHASEKWMYSSLVVDEEVVELLRLARALRDVGQVLFFQKAPAPWSVGCCWSTPHARTHRDRQMDRQRDRQGTRLAVADHVEEGGLADVGPGCGCGGVWRSQQDMRRGGGGSDGRLGVRGRGAPCLRGVDSGCGLHAMPACGGFAYRPMKHTSGSVRAGKVSIDTDPTTKSTERTRVLPFFGCVWGGYVCACMCWRV